MECTTGRRKNWLQSTLTGELLKTIKDTYLLQRNARNVGLRERLGFLKHVLLADDAQGGDIRSHSTFLCHTSKLGHWVDATYENLLVLLQCGVRLRGVGATSPGSLELTVTFRGIRRADC